MSAMACVLKYAQGGFVALVAIFLAIACDDFSKAASIAWSDGVLDDDAKVVNLGTTVEAVYFTGDNGSTALPDTNQLSGTISVNGVDFTDVDVTAGATPTNLMGLTYNDGLFGHTDATSGHRALIAGLAFESGVNPQMGTLTGLTPGLDYLVQVYYYNRTTTRSIILQDGEGGEITVTQPSLDNGVFATGIFTADDAIQTLNLVASSGSQVTNGYQLRQIPKLGDVNDDGSVDNDDFEIIRMNFLNSVLAGMDGDVNFDGRVDWADFRQWKNNRTAGGSDFGAVPEPQAIFLLLAAGMALAGLHRPQVVISLPDPTPDS